MLSRFVKKWASADYPTECLSEADLRVVEERFGLQLPEDYRQAVIEVGLPRPTIALMDAIVDRGLDLHSVGDFFSPVEMIEETVAWRELGMPEHMIAFASDGCGNKFCFSGANGAAIWFFDHDFGTIECIAPSFTQWIRTYSDIPG